MHRYKKGRVTYETQFLGSVSDGGLGLWAHEAAVQPVCIDIRKGELIRDTFFRKRRRWRVEFLGP